MNTTEHPTSARILEDMVRKADIVNRVEEEERKELAGQVKLLMESIITAKDYSESKPEDLAIVALDIMRYGPDRCSWGPWWFLAFLDCEICHEVCENDEPDCRGCPFEGAPDNETYEWSEKGLEQFVIDRSKWALPLMNRDLPDLYKALRELPQEQLIRRTLSLLEENGCFYSSTTTRSTLGTSLRP